MKRRGRRAPAGSVDKAWLLRWAVDEYRAALAEARTEGKSLAEWVRDVVRKEVRLRKSARGEE